ncbi:NAD-dependent epimerase/dehydratase family protein [Pedobacter sp. LMG 31464]|uniref:GDP-mannose 4,6-dehydratase n=1 Tax=Pedobacter planticolens TaxID=2679964 RepID=A0A923DXM4_9SPHI|nr:GDP-mannose 4,6-dehydratase [Pedobacter planticolens]MBB2145922.1 NAD-dependent epimerase/dehydratase family protein [Pedobacter planticolens]
MIQKKALICGVSGQDGAYLAKLLIEKNYQVFGGSRDAQNSNFENLKHLEIFNLIEYVSISVNDFRSVLQVIMKIEPDEIYNLAGQSSVALSFEQPVETLESIGFGTLNLLEAIRFSKLPIKLYNAGSSECFGNVNEAVNEETPFRPRSPYGVAKATAFWEVSNYREAYNLFACTGILFNHESPFRKERFVTKKIISSACRIFKGSTEKLVLGNINVYRDWGWAPEYVEAMWLMLQQKKAEDFVIATGESISLKEFVIYAFESLNLDWTKYVTYDDSLLRPTDIDKGLANPKKAKEVLKWEPKIKSRALIELLIKCELNEIYI